MKRFFLLFVFVLILCPTLAWSQGTVLYKDKDQTITADHTFTNGAKFSAGTFDFTGATVLGLTGGGTLPGGGTSTLTLHGPGSGATWGAVSLTADVSGTLPVSSGGTSIGSGTSGGVPYFVSTGAMASSNLLTLYALMAGGGAGGTPVTLSSLGTTTTLLHGNASGYPSYGAVNLATDVTGLLPAANFDAIPGSTLAGLPAAGTAGRLRRLTTGPATGVIAVDDGSAWNCDEEKSGNVFILTCPRWGVKADGSTDDGPAIQAVYNALPAAGGEVRWPPGFTYQVNTTITVPDKPITTTGGGESTIIQGTADPLIAAPSTWTTPQNFQHFHIKTNGAKIGLRLHRTWVAAITFRPWVRDVTFEIANNASAKGISLQGLNTFEISNCRFFGTARIGYGIYIDTNGGIVNTTAVMNGYILDNHFVTVGQPIYVNPSGTDGPHVENLKIANNNLVQSITGIYLVGVGWPSIVGNQIDDNTTYGIYLEDSYAATIVGNTSLDADTTVIYIKTTTLGLVNAFSIDINITGNNIECGFITNVAGRTCITLDNSVSDTGMFNIAITSNSFRNAVGGANIPSAVFSFVGTKKVAGVNISGNSSDLSANNVATTSLDFTNSTSVTHEVVYADNNISPTGAQITGGSKNLMPVSYAVNDGSLVFEKAGVTVATLKSGVQIGAPTGGDKGADSINVKGTIWTNGTQGITKTCSAMPTAMTITNGLITSVTGGTCS